MNLIDVEPFAIHDVSDMLGLSVLGIDIHFLGMGRAELVEKLLPRRLVRVGEMQCRSVMSNCQISDFHVVLLLLLVSLMMGSISNFPE